MGERDNPVATCCFRYRNIPEFKFCPVCGQPLQYVAGNIYRLYKYQGGRLVATYMMVGTLKDVLDCLTFDNYEYSVELVTAGMMFLVAPISEQDSDQYTLNFTANSEYPLSKLLSHVGHELPGYRIVGSSITSIKLRRS